MHLKTTLILVLWSFSTLFAQTQIAVADFEALGIPKVEARALTNRLMNELFNTGNFIVLEREMLDKIIEEQKFQLSGCNSDVCLVKLGQIANVEQIVGGSISKVGDVYSVTSRLISVETGGLIRTGTYDHRGNIGELMLTGMTNIAAQLVSIPLRVSTRNGPRIASDLSNSKNTSTNISDEYVSDVDGNLYRTIQIGDQVWMAENLKVTHYQNGDAILHVPERSEWNLTSSGAYSSPDNYEGYVAIYGRLYNWRAINDARKIAPEGWHVPTEQEWKKLEINLGMSLSVANASSWRGTREGDKLKSTNGWYNGGNGNNMSGFTAKPCGQRRNHKSYSNNIGHISSFWTATAIKNNYSWARVLSYNQSGIGRFGRHIRDGLSVRCIKD